MIAKASFRNFKSLRDVSVDLERFTVFVGPNASGKSSILQGLDLLCRAFHLPSLDVRSVMGPQRSRGSHDSVEVGSRVSGHWYCCRVGAAAAPKERQPKPEAKWIGDGCGETADPSTEDWKEWKAPQDKTSPLPRSVLLRLEVSKLISPETTNDPTSMSPDGKGLHSALANTALNDPDTWQQLQVDLRRIIPTIRRLRHTRKTSPNQLTSLLFDTVGADSLSAQHVSEGTLLVLGMLAALYAESRPNLVLLDDLDRGLHPKAQKELITLLRGLLDTNQELQIVASTHSPYLLDCVDTNEVRMTFLDDDGATMCAPLTNHPQFPKWKDEMTPGEMWSLFGEKWLVEGASA